MAKGRASSAVPRVSGEAYLLYIEANEIAHYWAVQEDIEKPGELFEEAIRLDPEFGLAFAQLSQLEIKLNEAYDPAPARYEKAMADRQSSTSCSARSSRGALALGKCFAKEGWSGAAIDADKAMAEFAVALRGSPNDPNILTAIARIERHQGKWAESTAHLEKAASLDPNKVERWHRFFSIMRSRGISPPRGRHSIVSSLCNRTLGTIIHIKPTFNIFGRAISVWQNRCSAGHVPAPGRKGSSQPDFTDATCCFADMTRPKGFSWRTRRKVTIAMAFGQFQKPHARRTFMNGKAIRQGSGLFRGGAAIDRADLQARPFDAGWRMVAAELYAGLGRKEDAIGKPSVRRKSFLNRPTNPWALGCWKACSDVSRGRRA